MKKPAQFILVFAVISFLTYVLGHHEYTKHKEPPQTYCVVEDEAGNFFVKSKDCGYIYTDNLFVRKHCQQAINLAWSFKEYDDNAARKKGKDVVEPVGHLTEVSCGSELEKK